MKRPSSRKDEAEDGEPETKKKPAASGSMNKAINELKHGLRSSSSKKDEDDNEEESGGEEEESHLRDKGKSIKFNSMRRSLPAHIIHLYDTEALSKPSPREFRTQVIHQLFTKLKNGRYYFERGETNVSRGQKALRAQIRQGFRNRIAEERVERILLSEHRVQQKQKRLRVTLNNSQLLSTSLSTTTLNKSFTYSLNLLSQPPSRHTLWTLEYKKTQIIVLTNVRLTISVSFPTFKKHTTPFSTRIVEVCLRD